MIHSHLMAKHNCKYVACKIIDTAISTKYVSAEQSISHYQLTN
jgi:hypothetical protein